MTFVEQETWKIIKKTKKLLAEDSGGRVESAEKCSRLTVFINRFCHLTFHLDLKAPI